MTALGAFSLASDVEGRPTVLVVFKLDARSSCFRQKSGRADIQIVGCRICVQRSVPSRFCQLGVRSVRHKNRNAAYVPAPCRRVMA